MRRVSSLRLLAAAVAVFAIAACGGDDDVVQDTVTPVEAALAARAAVFGVQTGFSNSSTMIFQEQNKPGRPAAPQHLFGLECPEVELGPLQTSTVLLLEYGAEPGCTSELDGQVHSGMITISSNGLALNPVTFDFANYATGDFTIDGGIEGTINLVSRSIALEIVDLFLSGGSGNTVVDGNLSGSLDANESPLILTDDEWTIRGEIVVTGTDQKVYVVEIEDDFPVHLRTNCAWPVSGVVSITVAIGNSGASSPPTTIDFGAGACDELAVATVGNQETTVHLPTGQIHDDDHNHQH